MTLLRLAAAGIVAVAAFALATASVVAFYAGGYTIDAATYAVVAVALLRLAARLRRRRRRALGYLPNTLLWCSPASTARSRAS